ncbi:MAG: glycosyltransferase family 2 protein [Planctomycetes bacterium]|nr:glycosyltransferase family 2 protein [Planctomycetota bacterium]
MTPRVSVVVTNFDGEQYLPRMRDALRALEFPFHEILVSDDASRDGSRLFVRHHWPEARLLCGNKNGGPTVARNRGLRAASGEFVLLLDNDGLPQRGCMEPMLAAFAEDTSVVGVMPRIVLDSEPALVHCDGAFTHFSGQMALVTGHVPLAAAPVQAQAISSLMGTAMLLRREAALRIGGFEPAYFFYYEDHDFGTRLRLVCGTLRSAPQAHIRHLGGTRNLSFRSGAAYPARRAFLTARNRQLFTLRTLSGRSLALLSPLLVLHELAQAAYSCSALRFSLYAEACIANARRTGGILRERAHIQEQRTVGDTAILGDGPLPLHPGTVENPTARVMLDALSRWLSRLYQIARPHLR